jgi:hypothetical protein
MHNSTIHPAIMYMLIRNHNNSLHRSTTVQHIRSVEQQRADHIAGYLTLGIFVLFMIGISIMGIIENRRNRR